MQIFGNVRMGGTELMTAAGARVADIERRWSKVLGAKDFAHMSHAMQRLLDELAPQDSRR
jgi:hypothetical protein